MKSLKPLLAALTAIPLLASSCATTPQAFHELEGETLIIKSLDCRTCQILRPAASETIENSTVINRLAALPKRHSAVVILENYNEAKVGPEFRNRSSAWFMGLRTLGYEHIVFLQGNGGSDPEGLIKLAQYD